MSNPISSLSERPETEPELEVDELLDENPPASLTEFDAPDQKEDETAEAPQADDEGAGAFADTDSESSTAFPAEPTPAKERSSRMGLVALVLAGLLLVSVAINLRQSGTVSQLDAERAELQQALDAAIGRIDAETARANGAEAALDRVDRAVDVVNERVLGLQEALDGLREATVR